MSSFLSGEPSATFPACYSMPLVAAIKVVTSKTSWKGTRALAELCVTIARRRQRKLLEEMEAAAATGARLMEIRLDFLGREPDLPEILKHKPCPLIATVRRRQDGGQWSNSEEKRLLLLRLAVASGFDYVDLEWDIADKIPRYGTTKRLISHHDMQEMPVDLDKLYEEMQKRDPDVIKIAARANHTADNFRMAQLLRKASVPTVAFCMGDMGTLSRVMGAKLGSPFTYAAFNPERIVAPGLLTFAEMRELYRYETINADTEIFGVIGDPIGHSLSPLVHNTAFAEMGLNKVYVPIRVPAECLDELMKEMGTLPIAGLSVTIPHKQGILRGGAAVDPLVKATGSANTMLWRKDGYDLYNTDGPAAISSLINALPTEAGKGGTLKDKTVLILGAGGVSRTIAHALHSAGALVTVTNRHIDRATDLAKEVGCSALDWGQRHGPHFDIIVNCTPVGMSPDVDKSPFHPGSIRERMVVFDTIYNPETTQLLRSARERDAITVSGVQMFVRQAEAQFKLFTGSAPPPGLMETLVREELSPARNMLREARLAARKNA